MLSCELHPDIQYQRKAFCVLVSDRVPPNLLHFNRFQQRICYFGGAFISQLHYGFLISNSDGNIKKQDSRFQCGLQDLLYKEINLQFFSDPIVTIAKGKFNSNLRRTSNVVIFVCLNTWNLGHDTPIVEPKLCARLFVG